MVEKRENGRSERGASMVEYALLVSLIAVVAIAGITLLGQNTNQTFTGIAGQIQPPAQGN